MKRCALKSIPGGRGAVQTCQETAGETHDFQVLLCSSALTLVPSQVT